MANIMNPIYKFVFPAFLLLSVLHTACKKPATETTITLDDYQIEAGFQLEVIASEPLINSPVAMDFDDQGRLWVLEMPGYMPNINGTGEEEPVGRIVILEDQNSDGHFEKAKTFLDGLVLARAMKLVYGGVLYAEPPNLWFVEIAGDKAGKKTLVDPEYVVGGNVEHQPNGLDLNIDNWIYSAKGVFRYRLKNGEWLRERTSFRGQWGICHDDTGRLFYNDNSNPLYGDFVLPNQLNQNPFFKNEHGENEVIITDRRVFPIQATAVNRGYIEGMLDENNFLKTFTSACGPVIYRGAAFPEGFEGNAFVCGPEANLVKRLTLTQNDYTIEGEQAYEGKEFLISNDEAFRPVNLYNGADGALYIVDYHHGIIQHKVYMTAYLRELYLERGLDTIVNYGRILKVSHTDTEGVDFSEKSNLELVPLLKHKNGWVRDRAQQILIQKQATDVVPNLKQLAISSPAGYGVIHALWTLEGLDRLDHELLLKASQSQNPEDVITAVRLSEEIYRPAESLPILQAALDKKNKRIDLQICLTGGKLNEKAFVLIQEVLDRYPQDSLFIEAALSSLAGKEKVFHYFLTVESEKPDHYPILNYLVDIIQSDKKLPIEKKYTADTDTKTKGLKLYRQHCAACHGEDGLGNKNLAPPIYDSNYIKGDPQKLILIALHGLQGPVTVNGQRYELNAVMPGLKDNPDLSNTDIANILSFVRNAFSNEHQDVTPEEIQLERSREPKGVMYTEEELGIED
ncbi:MAG: mono/diheme cytochrome c family protein [Saprospiraceae bacterium]|jgi:mono/diheme cytochrome c family protein